MPNERDREQREEAFQELYRYKPGVLNYLKRMGFRHEEIPDLAQQVWIRVYQYMDTRHGNAWGFIESCARTVAFNEIRSRSAQKRDAILEPEERAAGKADERQQTPEQDAISAARIQQITDAVQRLPPNLRQPLLLVTQGHAYEEVSLTLGISVSAVKSRVHEARKRLKEILGYLPGETDERP